MPTQPEQMVSHWLIATSLLFACGGDAGGDGNSVDDESALGADGSVRGMDGSVSRLDGGKPPPPIPRDSTVPPIESKQLRVACEVRYPQQSTFNFYEQTDQALFSTLEVESAPDGSAYVVGTFRNTLDLGAGEVKASEPFVGFLHKLDANCKPVRTIALKPTDAADFLQPGGIAVDAQGNVHVASYGGKIVKEADLGQTLQASELVIEKYAPSGERLYRTRLSTPGVGNWIGDVEVDAQSRLMVTGGVPSFSDLGAGPIVQLGVPQHSFAALFDAQGKFIAQQLDENFSYLASSGDSFAALASRGGYRNFFEFILSLGVPKPSASVGLGYDGADLGKRWTKKLSSAQQSWPWGITALSTGGYAVTLGTHELNPNEVRERTELVRLSIAGDELKRLTLLDHTSPVDPSFYFTLSSPLVRGTATGGLLMTGHYSGASVTIAGVELEPPREQERPAPSDAGWLAPQVSYPFVMELDANDQPLWAETLDWGGISAYVGRAAPLADGSFFLMGNVTHRNADENGLGYDGDVVVRKLRYEKMLVQVPDDDAGVIVR